MGYPVNQGVRLGVFNFESGDEKGYFALSIHCKGNGTFGGDEGEASLVKDIKGIKEDNARQIFSLKMLA